MKLFVVVLFLGFAHSDAGTHQKGSTVIDYLKDGFDAVYKFEEHAMVRHGGVQHLEVVRGNALLRKSQTSNESKNFILSLNDIKLVGEPEEPITDADFAAALLPVLVVSKNEDLDLDHIVATEDDTKTSLGWKESALDMLLSNLTEQVQEFQTVEDFRSGTFEMTLEEMPYGKCNMTFKVHQPIFTNKLHIEMRTKRSECEGDIDKEILEQLKEYDATDLDPSSDFKMSYDYDWESGQLLKGHFRVRSKAVGPKEIVLQGILAVTFDGYKEIEQSFDESKLVKRVLEANVE